jgi:hypothetical protein
MDGVVKTACVVHRHGFPPVSFLFPCVRQGGGRCGGSMCIKLAECIADVDDGPCWQSSPRIRDEEHADGAEAHQVCKLFYFAFLVVMYAAV